jgi:dihydropteroate synthase
VRRTRDLRNTIGVGNSVLGPDPVLVGALNVTPDSFSDGGDFLDPERAAARAATMLDEGAQIIDVGGESTRPGADPVLPEEEARRVVPVIRRIMAERPDAIISIDTYCAGTAEAALEAGARIVNDVTALRGDPRMAGVVADARCPVVLMHMLGEPKTIASVYSSSDPIWQYVTYARPVGFAFPPVTIKREGVLLAGEIALHGVLLDQTLEVGGIDRLILDEVGGQFLK